MTKRKLSKHTRYLIWAVSGLAGVLFLVLLVPSLLKIIPELATILAHRDHQALIEYVRSFGWRGAVILWALQFLQTLAPLFPEILLQLAAGVTYGPWWGTVILMTSYTAANLMVFGLLKKFHPSFLEHLACQPRFAKIINRYQDKNPELVVFIFYIIPLLTNSLVPYFAALTRISWRSYVFAVIAGCLPMMFVSVYLGDRLLVRDYKSAIFAFVLGAVFSIVMYVLKDKLTSRRGVKRKSKPLCPPSTKK